MTTTVDISSDLTRHNSVIVVTERYITGTTIKETLLLPGDSMTATIWQGTEIVIKESSSGDFS